jgi:hypothetical protein
MNVKDRQVILREYAKYLCEKILIINSEYENGSIYLELKHFYETGEMSCLLSIHQFISAHISNIHVFYNDIKKLQKDFNKDLYIQSYDIFEKNYIRILKLKQLEINKLL